MHEWLGMAFVAAALLHSSRHRNPFKMATKAVLTALIPSVKPVLGLSADEMVSRLTTVSGAPVDVAQSMEAIAKANKKNPVELLGVVLAKK